MSVPIPRSQPAQMSFHSDPIDGWESDDCSLRRSRSDCFTLSLSAWLMLLSAIRFAIRSGFRSRNCFSCS
ncbi:hypothetical protein D3C73_1562180 [compost metagenome]